VITADDLRYLKKAYEHAQRFGTDPSTQNGALLLTLDGDCATGANHFPFGVRETAERWKRPLTYSFVEHAERNAIFKAARQGIPTYRATLYCPWFACTDCARAIIQAGIQRVVGHKAPFHQAGHWDASITCALGMLEEAGVTTEWCVDKLFPDAFQIRFNGGLVSP
jgi:dCMP deaminase